MIEINACDLYGLRMPFPNKGISQLAIDLRLLLYLVGVVLRLLRLVNAKYSTSWK